MDKKTIAAIILSLGIWVAWQKLYLEPFQIRAAQEAQLNEKLRKESIAKEKKSEIDAIGVFPEKERDKVLKSEQASQKSLEVKNKNTIISLNSSADFINGWTLNQFFSQGSENNVAINIKDVTGISSQLRVRFSDSSLNNEVDKVWSTLDIQGNTVSSRIEGKQFSGNRKLILDEDGYSGTIEYNFSFSNSVPKYIFLDLYGSKKRENDKEGSIFGQAPDKVHFSYRDHSGRNSISADSLTGVEDSKEIISGIKWLGIDTRYFLFGLVPKFELPDEVGVKISPDFQDGIPIGKGSLVFPSAGKSKVTVAAKLYFGPKNFEVLKNIDPILVDAIDFGWTSFLAIPILHALKWLYFYVKNYGLAIILLTFFIKMMLFPLTYKSMKSMAKMAKLQPQLNALREKYKDDKEKLNVEMMNFMKSNGYNPVGGCLPIILQMPIFFALYRVLFNSMELYRAPFIFWIHDLSSPDPWFVLPVFLTGLMYLQQKTTPNTSADPAQQKMLQFMPIMFGFFMLMLPAGLNIYMVVNSGVSIVQQLYLNRRLGIGVNAKA